jgi:hypothetical protein
MRRWTIRIALCLALGVVTTVGVAWGLVAIAANDWPKGPPPEEVSNTGVRSRFDEVFGPSDWGDLEWASLWAWDRHWPGVVIEARNYRADIHSPTAGRPLNGGITTLRAGWPVLSLTDVSGFLYRDGDVAKRRFSGIQLGDDTFVSRWLPTNWPPSLPLRPLWPGFLINTLFYAAIVFGLFFAPGLTKRAIRRKRGRCVNCGYDLRGHISSGSPHPGPLREGEGTVRCPECGWNGAA